MAETIKKILLFFVFLVLLLPLIRHFIPFVHRPDLAGEFQLALPPKRTLQGWLDGSYQEKESMHLNDFLNFRSDLVRMNSQIDYSLFNKLNTGWGVLGKNGCLFDDTYLKAWAGVDFKGYDSLHTQLRKLRTLQDTFAAMGKLLLVVYAPSKPYYYPECLPDFWQHIKRMPVNLDLCLKIGDTLGINQVDANTWLCGMRFKSTELLYPKQGVHWSMYAGMLMADTLVKYVERAKHIQMPHPVWRQLVHTYIPRNTDDDIGSVMNLMWPMTNEVYTYGTLYCDKEQEKTKPNAIYIGDSFTWTLADDSVFDHINSHWQFWYYMQQVHIHGGQPRTPIPMAGYNWQAALDSAKYIVLIYTAPKLVHFGNGFIEQAYQHYYPSGALPLSTHIQAP